MKFATKPIRHCPHHLKHVATLHHNSVKLTIPQSRAWNYSQTRIYYSKQF